MEVFTNDFAPEEKPVKCRRIPARRTDTEEYRQNWVFKGGDSRGGPENKGAENGQLCKQRSCR